MTDNRRYVAWSTLALLAALTLASVINLHDMAVMTHAADGLAAWVVALSIGGVLSALAYSASITDGRMRTTITCFAGFAVVVSATLQTSLFLSRGASWGVALAFGVGLPAFEIAIALTDSMLRHAPAVATPTVAPVVAPVAVPATPRRVAKVEPVATPEPVQVIPVQAPAIAAPAPEPDKRTIAQEMLQAGKPKAEIARTLQVNPSTVHRWAKEWQLNGSAA